MFRQHLPFVLPEGALPRTISHVFLDSKSTVSSIFPFAKHSSAHLLHFFHMWKTFFHKLSSGFPQFTPVFPHLFRMWKTYQHPFFPHQISHIFVFFSSSKSITTVENHVESVEISTFHSSSLLHIPCIPFLFFHAPYGKPLKRSGEPFSISYKHSCPSFQMCFQEHISTIQSI